MLVFISAPYSKVDDKELLMQTIARFSGEYMIAHPGQYAVTGLMHHYALLECPSLGTDYAFWKDWCELFLSRCDKVIVLQLPGWETSTGVSEEIKLATKLSKPIEFAQLT